MTRRRARAPTLGGGARIRDEHGKSPDRFDRDDGIGQDDVWPFARPAPRLGLLGLRPGAGEGDRIDAAEVQRSRGQAVLQRMSAARLPAYERLADITVDVPGDPKVTCDRVTQALAARAK